MERSNYHISLDIQESHSGVLLEMKQHDTSRRITITLTDGGRPYEIAQDCYGVFTAKKPDGTAIFNDCRLVGNTLIYDVTAQTTAEAGELACQVRLYGSDDQLLSTAAFQILVCPKVVSDDDDIASMPESTTLARLLDRVEKVEDFMDDSILADKAWSAKRMVDALCPPFTVTGSLVSCRPLAGYPLAVTTEFSGEDSAGLTLWRGGKNLIPYPFQETTKTVNGITFTDNGDGSITANGTATADAVFSCYNNTKTPAIKLPASIYITLSGCPSGGGSSSYYVALPYIGVYAYGIEGKKAELGSTELANNALKTIQICIKAGVTVEDLTFYPQVEFGKVATAYETYRGESFTLTAPMQTVTALPGVNCLYCNRGDITVTGRKDIISILEGIENGD